MTAGPAVLYGAEDGIATIRFNRPDRLNALSVEVAEGFAACADRALADDAVRVIVVTSAGRAFVAGGDLAHFRDTNDKRLAAAQLIGPVHSALDKLAASPAITIGSLRGAVAGGGMSLALSLDLLVAAEDTSFNLAYARVGATIDCGGSWTLPRLVGFRKALEIALLSETIDAKEALRLGLVNKITPLESLEDETMELAARLARGAAVAQGNIKALIRQSFDRPYGAQLAAEAKAFADCSTTADFTEAVTAFFEKRKPRFQGR